MKKNLSIILLLCCILTACSQPVSESQPETIPVTHSISETSDAETEASPSKTEEASFPETEEAVLYPNAIYRDDSLTILPTSLNVMDSAANILSFGNYLLLVESEQELLGDASVDLTPHTIHLTVYDPRTDRNLHTAEITLPGASPYGVQITEDALVAVASGNNQEMVFLDETLTEQSHFIFPDFTLPDTDSANCYMQLSPDFSAGYCTDYEGHNLYRIDTDQTVTLLLQSDDYLVLNGVLFDGTCFCVYDLGNDMTCFLSSTDGEILDQADGFLRISSNGLDYLAHCTFEDGMGMFLYGNASTPRFVDVMQLNTGYAWYNASYNWENRILVNYLDSRHSLCCYDLNQKKILAQNDLMSWIGSEEIAEGITFCNSCFLADGSFVCLLNNWNTNETYLAIWDYTKEPSTEDVYEGRHSVGFLNHDAEKKEQEFPVLGPEYDTIQAFANQIEETFGIEIRMAEECSTFNVSDFNCDLLTDVNILQESLQTLNECLSLYPEGFFRQFHDASYENGLCIGLSGTLNGTSDTSLSVAGAITNVDLEEKIHWLIIDCSTGMDSASFHHEMSHVIDNHIGTLCYDSEEETVFSELSWSLLNPEEFSYSYDYNGYFQLDARYTLQEYWEEKPIENVFFLDTYAKTYPTEDRATLFSSACTYGTDFVSAPALQSKLEYMCCYIRHHFDTTGWPEITIWEQGLLTPLQSDMY